MTAMTLSTRSPALEARSQRAARAAVDRVMGDAVSPELKKAASDAVAPWAERLVHYLDDFIRIPGTKVGIGLDPIIGFLIPAAGDAVTGVGSVSLLFLALKERLPTIVFLRMCMNILVDTVGGLFPFVGDAFDLVWKSNKRNLALIEKYRGEEKPQPTFADYALVGLGVTLALLSVALPLIIIYGIGLSAILGLGSIFGS
ncbi:DUF4112 domain-containing protein [bacterium AH-315-N03]|nr:DUF4112 domain-containing protein [bacterium AH-315-N03]MBN4049443.1 DUF4112 domain-containing protein [bacterium AH-315-N03]